MLTITPADDLFADVYPHEKQVSHILTIMNESIHTVGATRFNHMHGSLLSAQVSEI